jgi:hypothetical protein
MALPKDVHPNKIIIQLLTKDVLTGSPSRNVPIQAPAENNPATKKMKMDTVVEDPTAVVVPLSPLYDAAGRRCPRKE